MESQHSREAGVRSFTFGIHETPPALLLCRKQTAGRYYYLPLQSFDCGSHGSHSTFSTPLQVKTPRQPPNRREGWVNCGFCYGKEWGNCEGEKNSTSISPQIMLWRASDWASLWDPQKKRARSSRAVPGSYRKDRAVYISLVALSTTCFFIHIVGGAHTYLSPT